MTERKYPRRKLWTPLRKTRAAPFSLYSSCHWVVSVQWCWQLIHVQMSPLPGWQSECIKLTFPSVRMTGCSESRQQSCHKQLSALTIIRFIYWQRSGRTTTWKAASEDRDILSSSTGRTTMIIRRTLTLMGCCQSPPPAWKPIDWWPGNDLRHPFVTFPHSQGGGRAPSCACVKGSWWIELGHGKIIRLWGGGRKKRGIDNEDLLR